MRRRDGDSAPAAPLKHTPLPLAIIGGGAAGMFAAISAVERGIPCMIFERKARLGSKVLMTANGRCNFTKDIPPRTMLADCGEPVADWLAPAIAACPPQSVIRTFRKLGVKTKRTDDGRMFPASGQASAIVHACGDFLRDNSVPICSNCPVTGIQPMKNGFIVGTANFTIWATNVLIATGGLSFPKTGSVGDGQRFARQLGHRIEQCRAGLTGFELSPLPDASSEDAAFNRAVSRVRSQSGARYDRGLARILDASGREIASFRGEVDCESWGISGAAVYNCQRWLARHGSPDYAAEVFFGDDSIRITTPLPRPLKESIVTIGGVSREDVNPDTMMSRLHPGLYFAGEVLDVDGPTGGYNLTIAFATARLAVWSI